MSYEPDDRTSAELFAAYFKVGDVIKGVVNIRIDAINTEDLSATGTCVGERNFGFNEGEQVTFVHLYDEIWRVTSERNDHGHAVFCGNDYGGISIGS